MLMGPRTFGRRMAGIVFRILVPSRVSGSSGHLAQPALGRASSPREVPGDGADHREEEITQTGRGKANEPSDKYNASLSWVGNYQ